MKNIVLIGSGNLATQLGLSLLDNGYNIIQVWSQQIKNAINLAENEGFDVAISDIFRCSTLMNWMPSSAQ